VAEHERFPAVPADDHAVPVNGLPVVDRRAELAVVRLRWAVGVVDSIRGGGSMGTQPTCAQASQMPLSMRTRSTDSERNPALW
jgi:hypothetical protein